MASTRKKQDEKNLKTLRELVSSPPNKHCFDCNQRGPTYVNVTIGSFVCTKCSGMLRGLTPPHRVKSISMATFTPEEVELLQSRGNDHCRRTWLGLYEGPPLAEGRDEQQIHDFMTDKYERRRYYMEPSTRTNGALPPTKPLDHLVTEPKTLRLNGFNNDIKNNAVRNLANNTTARPVGKTITNFVANFESADIFNAVNNNNNNNHSTTQQSFANFDNNPVFNNTSMPVTTNGYNNINQQKGNVIIPPAPPEDRYAALKDLDNALKTQPTVDWNSGSSGGSVYSSPTPAGSVYSSPSPQSMYGSPSQGHVFGTQETAVTSNPFNSVTNSLWGNGANQNPFRGGGGGGSDSFKTNGFNQDFHVNNGAAWTPNPFKIGSSNGHPSNPFL